MRAESDRITRPGVTILAAGDPLAGDVAACLSGRFDAEPVVSPTSAGRRIQDGARALIILAGEDRHAPGIPALVALAKQHGCRIVVLGQGGLGLDEEHEAAVLRLPHLPSPRQLFDSLADLGPGRRREAT